MFSYSRFKKEIASLSTVISSNKQSSYKIVSVVDDQILFIRAGKVDMESINLHELYNFYINEKEYKTTTARNYLSSRVYSPGVAILKELQRIELTKTRTVFNKIQDWWLTSTLKEKSDGIGCALSLFFCIIFLGYILFF